MTGIVTQGVVAFCNLTEHEVYQGQTTGRYSIVVNMEPNVASQLEDLGVKVKDYEGKAQRKFASKFHVDVVDVDNKPVQGEIPYGSKVRLLWKASDDAHPQHGTATYLNKVRVVEFAEAEIDTPEEF